MFAKPSLDTSARHSPLPRFETKNGERGEPAYPRAVPYGHSALPTLLLPAPRSGISPHRPEGCRDLKNTVIGYAQARPAHLNLLSPPRKHPFRHKISMHRLMELASLQPRRLFQDADNR
jgi:hypothetical protein